MARNFADYAKLGLLPANRENADEYLRDGPFAGAVMKRAAQLKKADINKRYYPAVRGQSDRKRRPKWKKAGYPKLPHRLVWRLENGTHWLTGRELLSLTCCNTSLVQEW